MSVSPFSLAASRPLPPQVARFSLLARACSVNFKAARLLILIDLQTLHEPRHARFSSAGNLPRHSQEHNPALQPIIAVDELATTSTSPTTSRQDGHLSDLHVPSILHLTIAASISPERPSVHRKHATSYLKRPLQPLHIEVIKSSNTQPRPCTLTKHAIVPNVYTGHSFTLYHPVSPNHESKLVPKCA